VHRGTEGAGRIGSRIIRRPVAARGRPGRPLRLLGPLAAAAWLLLVVLSMSMRPSHGSDALLALLTLGGWGLGVLPVHSDSRARGPVRRSAAQPQPARSGVEAGLLQDGAER
jgi:hypothetical protein